MMEDQKAHEDREPNLAFGDDDKIDFEQLRRDPWPPLPCGVLECDPEGNRPQEPGSLGHYMEPNTDSADRISLVAPVACCITCASRSLSTAINNNSRAFRRQPLASRFVTRSA
jgi:hypothetical protein